MKIDFLTPPGGGGWGLKKIGFFCKNGEKIGFFCKNPARNWVVLIRFQTAKRVFYKANPKNFAPAAGSQTNYQSRHISSNNPPVICQSGRPQAGNVGYFLVMFYERHLTVPTIEKTVYLHPDSSISTNAVFASGISRFLLSREWCICIRTRPYPSSFARSICRFLASMKHCNPALPKFRTWRVIKNTWLVICSGTSAF